MHSPSGVDFQNKSIFIDVTKPKQIVFDHISGPKFRVTAIFDEEAGSTKLSFHQLFDTVAECEKVRRFAVRANEENFVLGIDYPMTRINLLLSGG
jgi:hypothetical protein